ncbi:MAG TPA: TonB-dependent receptor [Casimicrobiaceae bacterium]|nr:TonB-dependent receptor [Casimicrobiaceae bacterium]
MNFPRKQVTAKLACALGACGAVGGLAGPAFGQDQPAPETSVEYLGKITVTGSNIPTINRETGLPVQVITREDIQRANFQTAAELLNSISANISYGSFPEVAENVAALSPGFAGASLRGLGANAMLLLLNGRRIAPYAFAGGAVDLNVIPVAAIERVEILKDGASAIYGSDAIAGVVNFILRTTYQGAEAYAQYTSPEHTGGYSEHYNVTGGYGDLATQKFNAFAMVDYQKYGAIQAVDRPFSRSQYIPGEGVDQTSPSSVPANVDTPAGTRNPTGDPTNAYHNPTCLPPLSFPTQAAPNQCRFDGARFIDLVDASERLDLVGAFTWQINPDQQFFLQGLYVRNNFTYVGAPTNVSNATTFDGINHFYLPPTSAFYPHAFAQFFGIDGQPLNIRWRSVDLGPRTSEPIVEQWNLVAGMQGLIEGWSYNGALSYSENQVTDRYVNGYLRESAIIPIVNSGVVNPFGPNTPDVVAKMSSAEFDGTAKNGKGTLTSVDFHATNDIYEMPAGALAIALGAEARQWKLVNDSSADLASGNILQVGALPSLTASRNLWAAFAEANVPISKTLEGDVAVRYDHYSDFGSTTNPKLWMRWQPTKALLMRAYAGTGFGAPSLVALSPPTLALTSFQSDPARCPVTNSAQDCNAAFPALVLGNPRLQPVKSSQWGAGGIWTPAPGLSLGLEYFDVLLKDSINAFSSQTIFALCPDGIHGPTCQFIHRGPVDAAFPTLPGPIVLVDQTLMNLGKVRVTGIDFNAQYLFPKLDWGQFKLSFQGTYNIKYLQQQPDGSYLNQVNHELSPGAIPYWHHYLTLDWNYGPWSATLTENYQQGTYDAAPGPNTGNSLRVIGDYDIWNLSGSYAGLPHWTFSVGVKNLLDRNPPFSNQTASSAGGYVAGYDPTYADPRGRLYWVSVNYSFK